MKKALDVTTKGWSKENIEKLRQTLISQGVKFRITVEMPDKKTKWLYVRDPKEVEPYCKQVGASIIKIEDFQ